MKPPIIINANGDIYIYDSLEKAELDIEPSDVNNNIYVIYDSEGLLLIPTVVDNPVYDVIKIQSSKETRQSELRDVLIDFLSTLEHDSLILKTMSLEELVRLSLTYKTQ